MARISKETVTIDSAATIASSGSVTVMGDAINLIDAIGVAIQATYQWVSAPTAGKQLDFYWITATTEGGTYDTAEVLTMQFLQSFVLEANLNTTPQTVTIFIDGALLVPNFAKIAVVTNETGSNGTMTLLTATIEKPI